MVEDTPEPTPSEQVTRGPPFGDRCLECQFGVRVRFPVELALLPMPIAEDVEDVLWRRLHKLRWAIIGHDRILQWGSRPGRTLSGLSREGI